MFSLTTEYIPHEQALHRVNGRVLDAFLAGLLLSSYPHIQELPEKT
jgi:hypothetical protein